MGLFDFLKNKKVFVSENQFNKNLASQKRMNFDTLLQLGKYGVDNDSQLRLEYFFYTNEQDKASNLAIELSKLGYEVTVDISEGNKDQWVITGWTTKMQMDLNTVTGWTNQMCKLGYDNDCDFDGWGTFPDQDKES